MCSSWGAPPPPGDLAQTPVPNPSSTPYAAWPNGPSDPVDCFPIGVTAVNAQIQSLATVPNQPSLTGRVDVASSSFASPVCTMVKEHGDALY